MVLETILGSYMVYLCALYLFDKMSYLLGILEDSKDLSRPITLEKYLSFLRSRTVFSL